MIDWRLVLFSAVWIGGAAVALATLSYASWSASLRGERLRTVLQRPVYQRAAAGGRQPSLHRLRSDCRDGVRNCIVVDTRYHECRIFYLTLAQGAPQHITMNVIPTDIPDVILLEPQVFPDTRGFFMETYHARRLAELGIAAQFVQDNHSRSQRGTPRPALSNSSISRQIRIGRLGPCAHGSNRRFR
jgi:hypothetical protein